jgi:hypothetical protein
LNAGEGNRGSGLSQIERAEERHGARFHLSQAADHPAAFDTAATASVIRVGACFRVLAVTAVDVHDMIEKDNERVPTRRWVECRTR